MSRPPSVSVEAPTRLSQAVDAESVGLPPKRRSHPVERADEVLDLAAGDRWFPPVIVAIRHAQNVTGGAVSTQRRHHFFGEEPGRLRLGEIVELADEQLHAGLAIVSQYVGHLVGRAGDDTSPRAEASVRELDDFGTFGRRRREADYSLRGHVDVAGEWRNSSKRLIAPAGQLHQSAKRRTNGIVSCSPRASDVNRYPAVDRLRTAGRVPQRPVGAVEVDGLAAPQQAEDLKCLGESFRGTLGPPVVNP